MIPELLAFRRSIHEPSTHTVWHTHPTLQVGLVQSGEFTLHLPQMSHTAASNDFFLIADRHLHRIDASRGSKTFHGFISLSDTPQQFSKEAGEAADFGWIKGVTIILRQASCIEAWLQEIADYWQSGTPTRRLVAQGLLLRLLASIETREGIRIPREDLDTLPLSDYEAFHDAVNTIERLHRNPQFCVRDIAATCAVSPSYLYNLFLRHVGYGPKRFLQHYRVDRAKALLQSNEHSIKNIAEAAGFPDVYMFSRVFKRVSGLSPSAYRHLQQHSAKAPD